MRITLLVFGVVLVVMGVLTIGKAIASKPKKSDEIEPTAAESQLEPQLEALTIDSYALRAIRPGPLVPATMTPTVLIDKPGTVAPGIVPT